MPRSGITGSLGNIISNLQIIKRPDWFEPKAVDFYMFIFYQSTLLKVFLYEFSLAYFNHRLTFSGNRDHLSSSYSILIPDGMKTVTVLCISVQMF